MTDLFLEPKVLNYHGDRYELILLTLRWARTLKSRGSPEPMAGLVEKALRDIIEGRTTAEEIMANKPPAVVPPSEAVEEMAAALALTTGNGEGTLAPDDETEAEGKPKKARSKKKKE